MVTIYSKPDENLEHIYELLLFLLACFFFLCPHKLT